MEYNIFILQSESLNIFTVKNTVFSVRYLVATDERFKSSMTWQPSTDFFNRRPEAYDIKGKGIALLFL
jgi:hypothetical protein